MNADIGRRWIAALRSGEYKQGQGKLRSRDHYYCCLGVLCDLHSKDTGTEWDMQRSTDPTKKVYLGETNFPPQAVQTWAGMGRVRNRFDSNLYECEVSGGLKFRGIAKWNDSENLDFNEIADRLEQALFLEQALG